jgi:CubicO group peptidase (beta-lactamase class C family)
VDDLFLWDQALYTKDLVKQETLATAYAPARLNDGEISYYGYGWILDKDNPLIVQHSGSLVGFRTYLYRDLKNKNTVILLSNFTNDVSAIKEQIVRITGEQ